MDSRTPAAPEKRLLEANLAVIRGRVAEAARRAGRDPAGITLLAATKTVPAPIVALLPGLGIGDAGENRVQEAESKVHALSDLGLRWHMIGRLQTNKVRRAMDLFHRFHSVDRDSVLDALAREGARRGRVVDCLIQVNVSGESTKGGYEPAQAEEVLRRARTLPSLRVTGLMAIPSPVAPSPVAPSPGTPSPGSEVTAGGRGAFRLLRELRDGLRAAPDDLLDLSMGMSDDYPEAVEEGATLLRIGSALFHGLAPEHFGRTPAGVP